MLDYSDIEQRSYRGNSNIKMAGVQTEWTPELVQEYKKCMEDPVYFIENYMKVLSLDDGLVPFKMYDYQKNLVNHYHDNRFNITLACRQSGKCADYSTKIDIRFKETKETLSISMGYLYKYIYTVNNQEKRYVSKEQIYKDLLEFDRKETEKCFEVLWRNTSHNSEESWRNKREVKFSKTELEGALYSPSITDKDGYNKGSSLQNVICSNEYGNHSRIENKLSFVRIIAEEIFRDFVRKNDGSKQSFLWKKTQKSSERNVEQKSFRRNEENNIRIFKENVEGKSHTEKSTNGRREGNSTSSDVGILERPEDQGRTFKANERSRVENRLYSHNRGESKSYQEEKNLRKNEGARIFGKTQEQNIKEFDWESFLGGYKRKDSSKRIECSDANMPTLSKNGQRWSNDKIPLRKLSEEIERKYVGSFDLSGVEIWTNTGWKNLYSTSKTVPYRKYKIVFDNTTIQCADDHIFIDLSGNEIFAKDLKVSDRLNGGTVLEVIDEKIEEHMYDVCVEGELYYTNGILSHNSITTIGYLLWYVLFNSDKNVAVLANKGDTAREMLSRLTLALENVPFFLQPGCKEYNKSTIAFENNTKLVARATSASSIRGMSINLLYLDEFAFVENAEQFYTSTYPVITSGKKSKVIITSTANGLGNPFYNIWQGAITKSNEFASFRVDWWDVPGRDEEWKKQTISNTSELQFAQEFSNCLESSSQIQILLNNIVYDIRIGDLYEAIARKDSCGLSLEEEIRQSAICWNNNKR